MNRYINEFSTVSWAATSVACAERASRERPICRSTWRCIKVSNPTPVNIATGGFVCRPSSPNTFEHTRASDPTSARWTIHLFTLYLRLAGTIEAIFKNPDKLVQTRNLPMLLIAFELLFRRATNGSVLGRHTLIIRWRTTRSDRRVKDLMSIRWRNCWSVTYASWTSIVSMPTSCTRQGTQAKLRLFRAPTATRSSHRWNCCASTPTTLTPMPCTRATSAIRSSPIRPRSALMPSYTSISTLFQLA